MDHVVVRLSGEITAANAGRVGRQLQNALRSQPTLLEVDLGNVAYLSSDGCEVFFMMLPSARSQGTRVIATHVRRQALSTLHQLGGVLDLGVG